MSTNGEPSVKRKRNDSSDTLDNPIVRSDLWFEDGSVILQAESTQFRVHRSILSRHSSVFADMFAVPQPVNEPTVEGCCVVHLSDSAEDVRHLLIALYDKNYNVRSMIPFSAVASMLRLGRKYEFEHLRDEAVTRLMAEFPNNLEEWDKLSPIFTHIQHQSGIFFDIINLAHENSVYSILPAAYYLCIPYLEIIFDGEKRADGSLVQLPFHVQRACVLGREKLLHAQAEYTLEWLDEEEMNYDSVCSQPRRDSCIKARREIANNFWKPVPECCRSLESWEDVPSDGMCSECVELAKKTHEAGRRKIWELLPTFFGLPAWSDLKNFEN